MLFLIATTVDQHVRWDGKFSTIRDGPVYSLAFWCEKFCLSLVMLIPGFGDVFLFPRKVSFRITIWPHYPPFIGFRERDSIDESRDCSIFLINYVIWIFCTMWLFTNSMNLMGSFPYVPVGLTSAFWTPRVVWINLIIILWFWPCVVVAVVICCCYWCWLKGQFTHTCMCSVWYDDTNRGGMSWNVGITVFLCLLACQVVFCVRTS